MRYKDPYTGLGHFACLRIDKPPSQKFEDLLELFDRAGRQWLCRNLGSSVVEAITIAIIYDQIVCEFAEAMGESIGGHLLNRSTEEEAMWQTWYSRIRFVNTPSVDALADILAQVQTCSHPGPRCAFSHVTRSRRQDTEQRMTPPALNDCRRAPPSGV